MEDSCLKPEPIKEPRTKDEVDPGSKEAPNVQYTAVSAVLAQLAIESVEHCDMGLEVGCWIERSEAGRSKPNLLRRQSSTGGRPMYQHFHSSVTPMSATLEKELSQINQGQRSWVTAVATRVD